MLLTHAHDMLNSPSFIVLLHASLVILGCAHELLEDSLTALSGTFKQEILTLCIPDQNCLQTIVLKESDQLLILRLNS